MSPADSSTLWSGNSIFLPSHFHPSHKVALLAGKGQYPERVWDQLEAYGVCRHLIAFEEETSSSFFSRIPSHQKSLVNVGQVGKWLKLLETQDVRHVLMAGQITPRKLFDGLRPDWTAIRLLARLRERNASTIFGTLLKEIEKRGLHVLDARSFLDKDLAQGRMTRKSPDVGKETLRWAIKVAGKVADEDIGQSVVVYRGTVVAVEAFEGTDATIERAGTLCSKPMGLVKISKKNQDFRFDVPVFGMQTLEKMKSAKIQWAALENQKTLLLGKEEIILRANDYGISIVGFER